SLFPSFRVLTLGIYISCCSLHLLFLFFFFHDPATPEIYTLSLHDALPILPCRSIIRARPSIDLSSARPDASSCWLNNARNCSSDSDALSLYRSKSPLAPD